MSIAGRMIAAWDAACFTTSDMALWFGVSRAAMNAWLSGKHEPFPSTAKQLEPPLIILERALKNKEVPLPIPLEIRQHQRKAYILRAKKYATTEISSAGAGSRGQEVLGTDNQG